MAGEAMQKLGQGLIDMQKYYDDQSKIRAAHTQQDIENQRASQELAMQQALNAVKVQSGQLGIQGQQGTIADESRTRNIRGLGDKSLGLNPDGTVQPPDNTPTPLGQSTLPPPPATTPPDASTDGAKPLGTGQGSSMSSFGASALGAPPVAPETTPPVGLTPPPESKEAGVDWANKPATDFNAPSLGTTGGLPMSFYSAANPEIKAVVDQQNEQLAQKNLLDAQKYKVDQDNEFKKDIAGGKNATALEIARMKLQNQFGNGFNTYMLNPSETVALSNAIDNGLDPYMVNSRTAKIYAQQELNEPGRAWNKLGASAKFERSTTTMNTESLLNSISPLLDKLLETGQALGNSNIQFLNKGINAIKEQTGDPAIVQFNNQRDDIVAEVERGLLGTGVLSDSKYLRALHNVNSAQSYPQLESAVKAMHMIISARMSALRQGPVVPKPDQPLPPSTTPPVGTVKGGYKFKGGDPSQQSNWEAVQ